MATIDVDGTRIWYDVRGSGPALLQIGGAGAGHESFGFITERMVPHFTVVNFDLPGYGESDQIEKITLERWVSATAGLLAALGIRRAHVHGNSMGGLVAMQLAATQGEMIDRLVLNATSAKSDTVSQARFRTWKTLASSFGTGSETLAWELASQMLSRKLMDSLNAQTLISVMSDAIHRMCPQEVFCAACELIAEADLTSLLPAIKHPTLVIAGGQDILLPVDAGPNGAGSRRIAELIPDARLIVLEEAGHATLRERPEEVSAAIVAFLR